MGGAKRCAHHVGQLRAPAGRPRHRIDAAGAEAKLARLFRTKIADYNRSFCIDGQPRSYIRKGESMLHIRPTNLTPSAVALIVGSGAGTPQWA